MLAVRSPFWLRSVGRRPAAFGWLLALSAVAMVVSVLAPMLLRSIEQVTLAEAVDRAGRDNTALVAASDLQVGFAESGLGSVTEVTSAIRGRIWAPALAAADSTSAYSWTGANGIAVHDKSAIAAPAVACIGASLVSGRCPKGDGEVALARSAAGSKVRVGDSIELDIAPKVQLLRVVGIYDDRSGPGAFLKSPSRVTGQGGVSSSPDLVISLHQFDGLNIAGTDYSVRFLQRTLTLDDLPGLRADIRRGQDATLSSVSAVNGTRFTTGIQGVVNRVDPQHDAAAILLTVTALEALGLAWFAEALVVQRIGRARAAEWGLARLRGLPRRRWFASIFVEPAVALVLGAMIGFVLGVGVAAVSARAGLGSTAVTEPTQPIVLAAAALSIAGSFVALLAASIRSARLPLAVLLRETAEPRALSRLALVAQTAIALLGILVIYSLATQTQISGPQIALLAPSVIAVLVGIIGLRVAILVIRRMTRRAPKTLDGVLVGRQLGRAPSALYLAVMVSVGVAVVAYSTQVAVVGDRLQDNRAAAYVGASEVLRVSVPSNVDFVQAVRRADPSGRQAMAAEVFSKGNNSGRLVAVDTSRLAAVSSWLPEWSGVSAATLRSRLAPATAASMTVTGTQISIALANVGSGPVATVQDTVALSMVVQNSSGWHTVSFGVPHDGTLVSPPGEVPCAGGCRVVWFGETRAGLAPPPFSTKLVVTGFSTDSQSTADLSAWLDPNRWRNRVGEGSDSEETPGGTVSSKPGGLGILFSGEGGDTASIATRDAPEPLPAVIGPKTLVTDYAGLPHTFLGMGPDLSSLLLRQVGRAKILPRMLGDGAMIDLPLANRVTDPAQSASQAEVWLAPGEHPEVLAALAREHILVTGHTTLASIEARFTREAPAKSAQLGLAVGAGALLLTLLAILAVRSIGAPARRRDWDSLRAAGVPDRRLRRALAIETLAPIGLAVLLGIAAGVVAFVVTVPHLPLLKGDGAAPPPDFSLAPIPLVALAVGELLVVATIAIVGARLELRTRRAR